MSRGCAAGLCAFLVVATGLPALERNAVAAEPTRDSSLASYPRIHLEVVPADSPVVPLLRAELDELGLTVVEGPAEGPSITVHAVLSRDSLEVRISDDATGNTELRELFSVAKSGRAMDPRTAVLHASELLRWHLHYQAPVPAAPREAAPAPTRPVVPAPTEQPNDLQLGVLPLAIYSPGGMQLGLGAELELSRRWSWFGVRALGVSSLVPNRMSVPEGQLQASAAWFGLESAFFWEPGATGTAVEMGLGAAVFSSTLRGSAGGDNVSRDDRLLTLAPFIELRAQQRLTRGIALVLASQCLLPQEAVRLRVLDQPVGHYGREVFALGLGLELQLF